MTDKTHYKESPYDERIEELALDIEATKSKANYREYFWRCYAVASAVIIFAIAAWCINKGAGLWGETLEVARIQEERASETLKMIGEKDGQIKALKDNLGKENEEIDRLERAIEQSASRSFSSVQAGRKLLRQLAKSVGEDEYDTDDWIKKLPREQAQAVRGLIHVHNEIMAMWPSRSTKTTVSE